MSSGGKCSECGAAIPADSPGGFCAQCLLGLGLRAQGGGPEAEASGQRPEVGEESSGEPGSPSQAGQLESNGVIAAPGTEKPGDRIGRYRLLQEIGRGGCGVVYMAEQEEPVRRKVALKVIKLGMDTRQVVTRFEAERQALALMDHPNIAKVLDAGATEMGRPFFVMELVGGVRITDYCDQNHLTTSQRLDLFIQVCRAIQHAHQKGIIHRDIKPSNVLVTNHDGTAVPKVIDFGIAKATQGRLTDHTLFTAFEQFIGTPAYMSPEQAQLGALDVDTRSDIYSLGVLLYELLTGKTPFEAKDLMAAGLEAMRRTIQEKEPPKPSTRLTQELVAADKVGRVTPCAPPTPVAAGEVGRGTPCAPPAGESTSIDGAHGVTRPTRKPSTLNPQRLKELIHLIRGDLDWIAMKCLEKDRARRYETANGLARDLERHLSNEPVVARPPTNAYRVQKFIRRNKVLATSIAAISAVVVMGITGVLWEWHRAVVAQRGEASARQRSENAERQVRESLRDAYLAQAQALRESDQPGRRFQSLDVLAEAVAIRPAMDLRNEAIACLMLPGLRPLRQWAKAPLPISFKFTASSQHYWTNDPLGNLTVRDIETDAVQFQLPAQGAPLATAITSPDERFFATSDKAGHAHLWSLPAPTPRRLEFPPGATLVAFTPDNHALVVQHADDSLHFLNTVNGVDEKSFPVPAKASYIQFDPTGDQLLAVVEGHVIIQRASDGKHLRTLIPPAGAAGGITYAVWHPDGRRVAVCWMNSIGLWDSETGRPLAVLDGHEAQVVGLAFTQTGEYLASASWDNTTRLWHTDTHREAVCRPGSGNGLRLSAAGRRLSFTSWDHTRAQLYELAACNTAQRFTLPPTASHPAHWTAQALFSPDGELVVVPDNEGVFLFQPPHPAPLALVPVPDTHSACLAPDGGSLFTGSADGLQRWPMAWSADRAELRLGPPEIVEATRGLSVINVDISRDGRWIEAGTKKAFIGFRTERSAEGVRADSIISPGHAPHLSPDGRLAASIAAPRRAQLQVWNPHSGALITNLPVYQVSDAAFSPDSRWLACGAEDSTTFWDTADWSRRHSIRFPPDEPARHFVAFSPDGRVAAIGFSERETRLVRVETGEELARLPTGSLMTALRFSPTSDRLAVVNQPGYFQLWDLRRLRAQLASMRLDWDLSPYPPEDPAVTKRPSRVVIHTNAPVTTPPR